MGGALIKGWLAAGAFSASDLIVRDPFPSDFVLAAAQDGTRLNPDDAALREAQTVVLAVKPQLWRQTDRKSVV